MLIADEVQTGFARTGDHFWGFEAHNVVPDIVVMGKGMGNGFPLAAVAVRREIAEAMTGHKFFNTYGSNPVSCAAGRAVLAVIDGEHLQENAKRVGSLMMEILEDLYQQYEVIGDVRGTGLMLGIEIVEDRDSKNPAPAMTAHLNELIREGGVIMGQSGARGNVLRMCPPLCISEEDMADFGEAMYSAFAANKQIHW